MQSFGHLMQDTKVNRNGTHLCSWREIRESKVRCTCPETYEHRSFCLCSSCGEASTGSRAHFVVGHTDAQEGALRLISTDNRSDHHRPVTRRGRRARTHSAASHGTVTWPKGYGTGTSRDMSECQKSKAQAPVRVFRDQCTVMDMKA